MIYQYLVYKYDEDEPQTADIIWGNMLYFYDCIDEI